jgi:hypothetical protein
MKEKLLKTTSLFLAFNIFFISCTKDHLSPNENSINRGQFYVNNNEYVEMKEFVKESFLAADNTSSYHNYDPELAYKEVFKGQEVPDYSEVEGIYREFEAELNDSTINPLLLRLQNEDIISNQMASLLFKLDSMMIGVSDYNDAFRALDDFGDLVINNTYLTNEEKHQALLAKAAYEGGLEYFQENKGEEFLTGGASIMNHSCGHCISINSRKIFGWSFL